MGRCWIKYCRFCFNWFYLLSNWAFCSMMPLPPGCRVAYEIRFTVGELTDEMGEWFNMIGGTATKKQFWDHRGREQFTLHVQYGKAKPSHRLADGNVQNVVRFDGTDASAASMFLIKFMDQIVSHNLKEAEHYVY